MTCAIQQRTNTLNDRCANKEIDPNELLDGYMVNCIKTKQINLNSSRALLF